MHLNIAYQTHYRFTEPQSRVIQLLRVTPRSSSEQTVLDWNIQCDRDINIRRYRDGYGNETTMLYVGGPIEDFSLDIGGDVTTHDADGLVSGTIEPLPPEVFLRPTPLTQADSDIITFAHDIVRGSTAPLDRAHKLNHALFDRMQFEPGRTNVTANAAQAFAEGRGICQDYAHIFCAAARAMQIPTRYVSGHLYRRDDAEDQVAAHGWAEIWIENLGWVAFDATRGICTDEAYVRVAVGLDYGEAAPLSGSRIGYGEEELTVSVRVQQQDQVQQ